MDKTEDLHDSIHTLCSIIHSHVSETESQIKTLSRSAQLHAHDQDLTGKDEPHDAHSEQDSNELDDEAAIYELEKIRLNLVMEIQEEDFVTQKLKDMLSECEELVGGVTGYYKNIHEGNGRDLSSADDHVKIYNETTDASVKEALESSLSRIEASRSSLYENARVMLNSIEQSRIDSSSVESQEKLTKLIDVLNEKYNGFVGKNT